VTSSELVYTKAQEMLVYLLENPRRTKDQIALALWPEATEEFVRSTFRVVLYYLRRALGDSDWILRELPSYYVFNRSRHYWYDAQALSQHVEEATRERNCGHPQRAISLLETALHLYRGDFGEGLPSSDWVLERREYFRCLHLQILLALGDVLLSSGEARCALPYYLKAVRSDKYSEAACRGAMCCYLTLHEPGEARSQYLRLCRDLWEELRAQPSVETAALLESCP
jgi:DNA-binding SARP family transcriptional activator